VHSLTRTERFILVGALVVTALSGVLFFGHANSLIVFIATAVALALLASTVGESVDQLGKRMGAGATGVLQSALGNLPELFVGIFALRAGLVDVVQAALVGSILANSLLVLGLAFLLGGLRHGTQRFAAEQPRMIATLTLLAVAALAVPTLAFELHTPAGNHADALSLICAIVLLVVFAASIPFSLKGGPSGVTGVADTPERGWPTWLTFGSLGAASVASAFVSDWFVEALGPTIQTLGLSNTFTGLVIVAIAGNAVENVVGVQFAARNLTDYSVSVILNSSLQVALGLIPVLVLLSFVIGGAHLTLVMPMLLVVALFFAAILGTVIVFDGESNWLEGTALIGLYGIIAASVWWG
jgi:Ca2+:H+ antiporter